LVVWVIFAKLYYYPLLPLQLLQSLWKTKS